MLMEHGADINVKINDGRTALKIAKERQFDPYVQQDNLLKRLIEKTIDLLQEHGAIEAGGKGGCFIATACYGSYDAPEVAILRKYRDEKLSKTFLGRSFIRAYYRYSPYIANMIKNKPGFNSLVRRYIIDNVLKLIKQ